MADSVQPDPALHRLRIALDALGVLPSDSATQQALTNSLLEFVALLAKWNRTYNLTAVRDPDQMLVQHVFDSAAVVKPLRERVEANRRSNKMRSERPRVLDVGSGAGLPGIVLALLWPDADFVLVEPVSKKAAFLQQTILELALTNVEVKRNRVEDLATHASAPDAIVCRAFASLADYTRAVQALAGPHTIVAAMKGRLDDDEKSALTDDWRIDEEVPLRVPELDAQRSLVVLVHSPPPAAQAADETQGNRPDRSPPSPAQPSAE